MPNTPIIRLVRCDGRNDHRCPEFDHACSRTSPLPILDPALSREFLTMRGGPV